MLQDKYLPKYHFSERHSISINAVATRVFSVLTKLEFSDSFIIKILFKLRGLPTFTMHGIKGLERMGFIFLEMEENKEIVLGLVGEFWKINGNIQTCTVNEFDLQKLNKFAVATWNFDISSNQNGSVLLSTETRIACPDKVTRRKFRFYWFFVRPFSGIVRNEILKSIKRRAEKGD